MGKSQKRQDINYGKEKCKNKNVVRMGLTNETSKEKGYGKQA
jgi:hypothetical protein